MSHQQFMDISSVFQAMYIQQSCDNNYYMDSRVSSHNSFNQSNMQSLSPCNSKFIMVGKGVFIHVNFMGQYFFFLFLKIIFL